MRQNQRPLLRSLFSGLLALGLPLGGALVLASVPGGVARAGDLKVRLAGVDALRPSALASATAADKHLYTLRELDPLVPQKYTTIAAKADKDVTVAIYGAGDPSLAFKFGATIRLAGGRAVPATVVVPPGTPVIVLIEGIHRDPAIYPDPSTFRPERFLERRPAPTEFLPFGGGHRRCLGAAFSEHEARIFLATLLSRVELETQSPTPSKRVRRNVTMGPEDGVPLRVTRVLS